MHGLRYIARLDEAFIMLALPDVPATATTDVQRQWLHVA